MCSLCVRKEEGEREGGRIDMSILFKIYEELVFSFDCKLIVFTRTRGLVVTSSLVRHKSVRSWCDGSSDRSFMGWIH